MNLITTARRLTVDQWRAIDDEWRAAPGQAFDWRPLVILVVVAISLTLQEFYGDRSMFARLVAPPSQLRETSWELWSFAYWTGWRVFGYLLLPMVIVAALPGERLRDYGFTFRGFARHAKIYVGLFVVILPLVWLMSLRDDFRRMYPFYRLAGRSAFDFFAWEAMYALQFVSLEFFFRGFMLHGMKRALGAHAIWVMAVPYCMIHYGKTIHETLGAIVAGLVLGTVALRTGSIWGGVLLHVGVAISMDLLCLWAMR